MSTPNCHVCGQPIGDDAQVVHQGLTVSHKRCLKNSIYAVGQPETPDPYHPYSQPLATPPPNPSDTPLTAICGLCGEYYGAHSNGGGFCPMLDESREYAGFSKEQKFYTEQERIAALERRAEIENSVT